MVNELQEEERKHEEEKNPSNSTTSSQLKDSEFEMIAPKSHQKSEEPAADIKGEKLKMESPEKEEQERLALE